MEHIDEVTLPLWLMYANSQTQNAVYLKEKEKDANTGNGSWHFERVLQHIPYKENEIWVAYITKADKPSTIIDNVKPYPSENVAAALAAFAKDIEMFVTVTSSPKALITSHMGIATSIEGAKDRTKGTSPDLLAFAAKVMLMRNPKRKFTVNAPVYAVEKIMMNMLPHSVYVGTRELCKALKDRRNLSFEEFEATKRSIISETDTADLLKLKYNIYKNLGYTRHHSMSPEEFLDIVQKHPPIISVDPPLIFDPQLCVDRCLSNKNDKEPAKRYNFTLFNPENPSERWLSIDSGNEDYQWIFMGPFIPALATHYIAINLIDLANSRPIA